MLGTLIVLRHNAFSMDLAHRICCYIQSVTLESFASPQPEIVSMLWTISVEDSTIFLVCIIRMFCLFWACVITQRSVKTFLQINQISNQEIRESVWYYLFTIAHVSFANWSYKIVHVGQTCNIFPCGKCDIVLTSYLLSHCYYRYYYHQTNKQIRR